MALSPPDVARSRPSARRPGGNPTNQLRTAFSGVSFLAALPEQTAERAAARFWIVALEISQVQPVDQCVCDDWSGERAGEREDRAEREPHDHRPSHPSPAARAPQLRVHDTER